MGGYGSGTRYSYSKKLTVEECRVLSAARLMHLGMLRSNIRWPNSVTWTDVATGKTVSRIGFDVDTGPDSGSVRLHYTQSRTGQAMDYHVNLTTTPLPWGGLRWWFICPLTRHGRFCSRRVGKLYLPSGAYYFGCRHCYDLTYTSCQESHKYDSMFAGIGAPMGLSARDVAKLLKRAKW